MGLHCLSEGAVTLSRVDAAGAQMLLRIAHVGDMLGYRAFFSDRSYSATAKTIDRTRLCFIDMEAVEGLLARRPQLALRFTCRLGQDLRRAQESRQRAATLPVRQQLVHLLLSLKDHFGHSDGAGRIVIELPLTRSEIASMIGARTETVIRAMRALERSNVACFRGREALVEDLDRLLDEVEPH